MDRALKRGRALEAIRLLFHSEPELAEETVTLDVEDIEGDLMPEPYRGLLVHARDMTHRLQEFVDQTIHLRPLHAEHDGHTLDRRVLLIGDDDGRTVEFGAIRIHLDALPVAAREDVVEGRLPLGAVLKRHRVVYICQPQVYFRLRGATFLADAFELDCSTTLHGRLNHIRSESGAPLAEVIEVLPPLG